MKGTAEKAPGKAAEEAAPKDPAAEEKAPSEEPRSKRSDLRAAGKGGFQAWMAVAGGAVVCLVVLLFFVAWFAALAIASALGLYVEATLARITRVSPSSPGSRLGPTLWGLIGFAPFLGVALYVYLRPRLVANSPEDIASPGMSQEDREYEGKVRSPALASPGLALVLPLVLAGVLVTWKGPAFIVQLDRDASSKRFPQRRILSFNQGRIGAWLKARSPLSKYGELTFAIVKIKKGGAESPVSSGEIEAGKRPKLRNWTIKVEEAGSYRIDVKAGGDRLLGSAEFKIRSQ